MQFVVIARDGDDAAAPGRRSAARDRHLQGARDMADDGQMIAGGAMLDETGAMRGSVMIMDFPDRAALDAWLASDPYTTGGVWRDVEVHPFRLAVLGA